MYKPDPIQTLIGEFQKLQDTALDFPDVEKWMRTNGHILYGATQVLRGAPLTTELHPRVRKFEFGEFDGIEHNPGGLSFVDDISRYFHLRMYCEYKVDDGIDLSLLCKSIPELGLMLSDEDAVFGKTEGDFQVVFTPKLWRMSAASMLYNIGHERIEDIAYLKKLCSEVLPYMAYDNFVSMYDAGLFSNEAMVCDWLKKLEMPSVNDSVLLPSNIAI